MLDMMRASPALTTLMLLFPESPDDHSYRARRDPEDWSLDTLTKALDQTFSQLRELSITGKSFVVEWHKMMVESNSSNPTRLFFLRHPHIQNLDVDCKPLTNILVSPSCAQELFPSLRHFHGPDFLCTALVGSDASLQLEVLEVKAGRSDIDSTTSLSDAAKALPKLRELSCLAQNALIDPGATELINVEALQKLLSVSPKLEKLVISSDKYFKSVSVRIFPLMSSES